MCGMLVLMYYFYNVLGEWDKKTNTQTKALMYSKGVQISGILLMWHMSLFPPVYIIIAIFCLASATALFSCLDAVMDKMGCATGR